MMNKLIPRIFGGYKGILFLFAILLGMFLHLYTRRIVNQLREESRALVQFYAQMYARVAETDTEDLSFLFDQIIRPTNFPLIQTDPDNNPVGWKGLTIPPDDYSEESVARLKRLIERMDRTIDPVPIKWENQILGYLYYGDSQLVQQLQLLPYFEAGIIGLFLLLGFIGYANLKRSEQRHIWVGMAKETAHQLGTPLSSLLGWLELMRTGKQINRQQIYDDMEKDLHRLQVITRRFSQIGSWPDLKKCDLTPVVRDAVAYIRRRTPQLGRQVTISESYENVPAVAVNADLFQWALENIMKNSLDAMDKKEAVMHIRLSRGENNQTVILEIEDNGRGIEGSKNRIFKPGFSTKKRGWGLGLTLARRIIDDYHKGRLYVKESRPGEGTVMSVVLSTR